MKKLYILTTIFILLFSLSSCKNKYELTENAYLLEYGKLGKYGFIFDDEYYYLPPSNVVIGMADANKKGKFSIGYAYYDIDGNVTSIVPRKTYILKKDQTITRNFDYGETEGYDENNEYYRYVAWREIIILYEGNDIYIDNSMF